MKNLKKLLVVFFFTVVVMAFALPYAASAEDIAYCDDGNHTFGEWNIVLKAEHEEYGVKSRTCSACSKTEFLAITWPNNSENGKIAYPVVGGYIFFDPATGMITYSGTYITEMYIPAEIEGIKVTGVYWGAVAGRNELKKITVDPANTYLCDIDGVLFDYDKTTLIAYPKAKPVTVYAVPEGVTRLAEQAFTDTRLNVLDLRSITAVATHALVGIRVNALIVNSDLAEKALGSVYTDLDCGWATRIDKTYFTGEKAGKWYSLLEHYCSNFAYNFNGVIDSKYTIDGGYIYYNPLTGAITGASYGVKNLDIPAEINGIAITAIEDRAFSYSTPSPDRPYTFSFDRVTIPGSVKKIGKEAFCCTPIKELIICDGVEEIGDYAFEELNGPKTLILPDSVTFIGKGAFYYSHSLESVTIPGSVKTISEIAFTDCFALKELTLCEGIETIGEYAFSYADITELFVPKSVKSIAAYAFDCCDLESVTYYSTTFVDEKAFNDCEYLKEINVIEVTDEPSVSLDGLQLTVDNLGNVKEFFIGKGAYNTYRELKNGNYVGRVTEANIADSESFTVTLNDVGDYTVCIRFDDPEKENLMLYCSANVDTPEFSTKGLQVLMSGLTDVRVIRTAPGVWETPGQVKRAEGARNIKGSSLKGADEFALPYSESGTYTLTLEYYNGLTVVKTFELERTVPTVEQDGNIVTFGNIDDLYVIRYAKGEFTYAGDIKRAEGAKFKRPSAIVNGVITIDDLETGTYTFSVQYNDMSYNYYTIVVE